jgi:hypothetical protein
MAATQQDAETKRLMASIRRLRAAFAPGIPKNAVVAELRKILESEGMENLLADSVEGYFVSVLSHARRCVEQPDDGEVYGQLEGILNSKEVGAALLTDDPDEQPARLRELMLAGPYRDYKQAQTDEGVPSTE